MLQTTSQWFVVFNPSGAEATEGLKTKSQPRLHRCIWGLDSLRISITWSSTATVLNMLFKHVFLFQEEVSRNHDDVIKWKYFPRYWPFARGIHRSPVNSPHKGQWHGALMFSLICASINRWVNNGEVGDLRCHPAHYDVNVMWCKYYFILTGKRIACKGLMLCLCPCQSTKLYILYFWHALCFKF